MSFYLANMGFEPMPTSTAVPSNTETTVIPTRPLRSLLALYMFRMTAKLADRQIAICIDKHIHV